MSAIPSIPQQAAELSQFIAEHLSNRDMHTAMNHVSRALAIAREVPTSDEAGLRHEIQQLYSVYTRWENALQLMVGENNQPLTEQMATIGFKTVANDGALTPQNKVEMIATAGECIADTASIFERFEALRMKLYPRSQYTLSGASRHFDNDISALDNDGNKPSFISQLTEKATALQQQIDSRGAGMARTGT